MGNWAGLSQQQTTFQLRLIFGVFLFLSSLYALVIVGMELARIFYGSVTQASVVDVSAPYNSHGDRVTSPIVDYEYFDPHTNTFCRGIYYASSTEPRPVIGQKINVEFIPGHNLSWRITDQSSASRFWPVVPPLILVSLLALSFYNQNNRRS